MITPLMQEIEDRLVLAAEARRLDGMPIVRRNFGEKGGDGRALCMCPMTCLTGDVNSSGRELADALGITPLQMWDIVFGIDGSAAVASDPEFYKLGERVAKRLGL